MNIYKGFFCCFGILSAALLAASLIVLPEYDALLAAACALVTFVATLGSGILFSLINDRG